MNRVSIASDNGLSPIRSAPSHYITQCRVIVNWTRRNNLQWILIKIQNFSFTKMHLKISSTKWRPLCPGEDESINNCRRSYEMIGSNLRSAAAKMVQDDHYNDVIMGVMASQIASLAIVYSCVYSDADQRKHQSSASLAFVRGIHRSPVNSPHKGPVTRKMSPFDDVIMMMGATESSQ